MPKLLRANAPQDSSEERQVRRLAGSRHAPGDWIRRAKMIVRSWEGLRTTEIARELACHLQTVRERIARFNAEGIEGLGDRPGPGRKPRLTEAERSQIIALAKGPPPGAIIRQSEGTLVTAEAEGDYHFMLRYSADFGNTAFGALKGDESGWLKAVEGSLLAKVSTVGITVHLKQREQFRSRHECRQPATFSHHSLDHTQDFLCYYEDSSSVVFVIGA